MRKELSLEIMSGLGIDIQKTKKDLSLIMEGVERREKVNQEFVKEQIKPGVRNIRKLEGERYY